MQCTNNQEEIKYIYNAFYLPQKIVIKAKDFSFCEGMKTNLFEICLIEANDGFNVELCKNLRKLVISSDQKDLLNCCLECLTELKYFKYIILIST